MIDVTDEIDILLHPLLKIIIDPEEEVKIDIVKDLLVHHHPLHLPHLILFLNPLVLQVHLPIIKLDIDTIQKIVNTKDLVVNQKVY
jgi:hypothetical protein